jgi:hypothetical protein
VKNAPCLRHGLERRQLAGRKADAGQAVDLRVADLLDVDADRGALGHCERHPVARVRDRHLEGRADHLRLAVGLAALEAGTVELHVAWRDAQLSRHHPADQGTTGEEAQFVRFPAIPRVAAAFHLVEQAEESRRLRGRVRPPHVASHV